MRTTNFDAIATSAPLDRQASVVRDGSGDLYEFKVPDHQAHWDAPPVPIKPRPAGVEDLTGRKFGQLTAVRYHTNKKNSGSMWLVRCSCGDYELRRAAVIKAGNVHGSAGRCRACDRVAQMREGVDFAPKDASLDAFVDRLKAGGK